MLSDPMWVLSENIVVDNIIKKVAEEEFAEPMLYAPPAFLGFDWTNKMSFYSINEEFRIPVLSMIERIVKKVAEEPIEPGANMEDIPQHIIDEDAADRAKERTKELRQKEMYDDEMWNWSGFR
tara:strand:- start:310 stop:678 length:369 start_codon:yes stop_codon:yes gene_type:complete